MRFDEQTVLISGGSRGIGAAIATAFAARGAKVAINYVRNEQAAQKHLDTLEGNGHIHLQGDVARERDCQSLIDAAVKHFGRLDILINNAGIHEQHPLEEVDYANWNRIWRETLEVNLLGPARLMYLAARQMMSQGAGRIVNVSSRGAFRGEPDQPAYGASKGGLNALGQSLAQKLAPHGVFVGTVAPGFVETDLARTILEGPRGDQIKNQSPLKRVARPEEVAYAVLFLASKGSEFSTGTIIDVNGASYLRS